MAAFLVGSGIFLIMFDMAGPREPRFNKIKQAIAILLIMIGTWMGLPEDKVQTEGITWIKPHNEIELLAALDSDKPVFIVGTGTRRGKDLPQDCAARWSLVSCKVSE